MYPTVSFRFARPLAVPALFLVLTGCGDELAGPSYVDTPPVATIVRTEMTDSPSYVSELRSVPFLERGESGEWDPAYADARRYEVSGEAWFVSRTSGDRVPVDLRTDGRLSAGSVLVVLDPSSGTISVLGLRRHRVWIRLGVRELGSA